MPIVSHGRTLREGPTRFLELRITFTFEGAPVIALLRSCTDEHEEIDFVKWAHLPDEPLVGDLGDIFDHIRQAVLERSQPPLPL